MQELLNIYDSSSELRNFIKNPTHSFANQLAAVESITKKMEFSLTIKNFLSILVIKRRIFFLKDIIKNFLKLSSIKKGKLNAQLVSSKSLSDLELNNVSRELTKVVGSEISFDYTVDKDLIGGFKMQVGSLMIDTSIKNKLQKYEQIMLEK